MADALIATPQAVSFGREKIGGTWHVVMKIHGQGHLKFPVETAHELARDMVGQCNIIDRLNGDVLLPWKR